MGKHNFWHQFGLNLAPSRVAESESESAATVLVGVGGDGNGWSRRRRCWSESVPAAVLVGVGAGVGDIGDDCVGSVGDGMGVEQASEHDFRCNFVALHLGDLLLVLET